MALAAAGPTAGTSDAQALAPPPVLDSRLLGQVADDEAQLVRDLAERLRHPPADGEEPPQGVDSRGLYDDVGSLVRYLRARQWDVERAELMIRKTAAWRREFNLDALRHGSYAAMVAVENSTGKLYLRGHDRHGRPILYMKPRNEQSFDPEGNVRHLVYNVERAVAFMARQEAEGEVAFDLGDTKARKLIMFVDWAGTGWSNMVPMSIAREIVSILQDHYPERLAQAVMINVPTVIWGFLSAIRPFLDPVTQEKFAFHVEEANFDLSLVEHEFGGTATEPFDSHTYLKVARTPGPYAEFGLEFSEQVAIRGPAVPSSTAHGLAVGGAKPASARAPLWSTISDPRVLALQKQERTIVRQLAQRLAEEPDRADEAAAGLHDDAGVLIRFLHAARWNSDQAMERLCSTARWRKSFELASLCEGYPVDVLARENAGGRLFVRGFDRSCRPIVVVRLSQIDLRCSEEYVQHAVYCIERAVAVLEQRQLMANLGAMSPAASPGSGDEEKEALQAEGRFTLLIDFSSYAPRHRPKLSTVRQVMRILQEHYPGRLGDAFLLNPPSKVVAWWRLASWFVPRDLLQRVVVVPWPSEKAAESLSMDAETLERCLDVGGRDAFDSTVFLSVPARGATILGAEFDAQLAAARANPGPPPGISVEQGRWVVDSVVNAPEAPKEEEEEEQGWLDSIFGSGSSKALW